MTDKFWTVTSTIAEVVGSIAGVVALILAVWLFLQARSDQSKKLEVELIARSTLVDENVARTKQRIEILYDGRKIPNYTILQFRVANTGGQPIPRSDYEEQLMLHLDNVSEILSIEQVSSNSKQLQVAPSTVTRSSIIFPMALLNPSDWFIVEVGIVPESGKKLVIEPKGRIAGVKQIVFKETIAPPTKEKDTLDFLLKVLIAIFIFSIYMYGVWALANRLSQTNKESNQAKQP